MGERISEKGKRNNMEEKGQMSQVKESKYISQSIYTGHKIIKKELFFKMYMLK